MRLRAVVAIAAIFALVGCGEGGLAELKTSATNAAAGAAKVASQFVDTNTLCLAAGQNEAFCGCLQTRLGAQLQPAQIDAVSAVIRDGLTMGVQAAAERAQTLDPATRDALIGCAAQGAVAGEAGG
jgi:formylmethanofuran:tetrahydromethanopterin formyltransferase